MSKKVKIKFTDFECNLLLINGMNELRNMFLTEDLATNMVTFSVICSTIIRYL